MSRSDHPWSTTVLGAALIFFLPYFFLGMDLREEAFSLYGMIPLVLINPAVYLFASIYVYARYGRKVIIPIGVYLVVTLLSVFLTYNESALVYVGFYAVLAGIGVGLTELTKRSVRYFRRTV